MFPKTGHTLGMVDVPEELFSPELQLAISLLSMFDFQHRGSITQGDWLRGIDALGAVELQDEWSKMAQLYDPESTGLIELARVKFVVPLDPMVGALIGAVVRSMGDVKFRNALLELFVFQTSMGSVGLRYCCGKFCKNDED